MKKTVVSLLLACVCVVLGACSKEKANYDDIVSQEQWLSIAGNEDIQEEQNVFLVEPAKSMDQVASYEEASKVINRISQLSADDFASAMVYDPNNLEPLLDNRVILLFQGEKSSIKIYGYASAEYGFRGIILSNNGEYSYFDLIWFSNRRGVDFYEQDFDHDGIVETAFCFGGSAGTGVEIYRLVIFDDVERTGTLAAYEFTPEMQLEQFENKLQFVVDMDSKKLIISKDRVNERIIEWERFGDAVEGKNVFGVDCLNQITFDINGDEIKMRAGIGILINQGGPTIFFEAEEGGELYFDVMYSDGVYEIK